MKKLREFVVPVYALIAWVVGGLIYVSVAYPTLDRIECLRSGPWSTLKTLTAVGDLGIFAAYMVIPVVLVSAWRRMKARPEARLLILYGSFILLCGLTHAVGVLTILVPVYWVAAKLKVLTAAVSVAVALVTFQSRGAIVGLGESGAALAREAKNARVAKLEAEAQARAALVAQANAEEQARDAATARADLAAANQSLSEMNVKLDEARKAASERAQTAETRNVDLVAMVARLEAQETALSTLESPILEALDEVLVSVLVGTMSSSRAAEWKERFVTEAHAKAARVAVIDVTGLLFVDTEVAGAILRTIRALKFIGTRCILTGARPEVATTLAGLDVDLGNLPTLGTLKRGLELAQRMTAKDPAI